MWLAVWPGVVIASSVKPLPLTISPSVSATSGRKSVSAAGIERIELADIERPRGAVRTFAVGLGAGRFHDARHRRRMIAMRMRDEDMGDGLAAHGVEQSGDVLAVVGARIDDRDIAAPDDIGDRSLEGERARIAGAERADAGRDLLHHAGNEVEASVEGNVFAHSIYRIHGRAGGPGLRHAAKPNIRS